MHDRCRKREHPFSSAGGESDDRGPCPYSARPAPVPGSISGIKAFQT